MSNKNYGFYKKTLIIFLSVCLLISMKIPPALAEEGQQHNLTSDEILDYMEGIINWKKSSLEINNNDLLLNNAYLENAGDTSGDWYPVGMGRIGYPDEYDRYLAVIRDVIENRYEQEEKLDASKATEWHRISIAILSSGGDPTKVGTDKEGEPINLIADGIYDRGKTRSLGTQGINGWVWGLIALDSMRYEVPEDAHDTRKSVIKEIITLQLDDGGFSLNSSESDPDITAMAVQALAPYYNSEETYTYEQDAIDQEVTKTVREVIDEALQTLSVLQTDNGDFESFGNSNSESTAQVIVALTSLGIDPLTDDRFIKNDNTVFDGLLNYLMNDGGFIHSESYDPDNPTAVPDKSNTMASEQTLYSLAALYRNYEGYRTLYDFREEMSDELKEEIESIQQSIGNLPNNVEKSDKDTIRSIFNDYLNLPVEERSYVYNYYKLADAMETLGIENTSEPIAEYMGVNNEGNGAVTPVYNNEASEEFAGVFAENDVARAEEIPDDVTTEYYVEVVSLIDKLENADNKQEHEDLLTDLQDKREQIEEIENEIDSLNKTIVEQIYPVSEIGIDDRENVNEMMERYESLSPYGQQKIQSYTDVERAEVQINNMIRARIITAVLVVILGAASFIFIRRRRKKKREKMEQQLIQ